MSFSHISLEAPNDCSLHHHVTLGSWILGGLDLQISHIQGNAMAELPAELCYKHSFNKPVHNNVFPNTVEASGVLLERTGINSLEGYFPFQLFFIPIILSIVLFLQSLQTSSIPPPGYRGLTINIHLGSESKKDDSHPQPLSFTNRVVTSKLLARNSLMWGLLIEVCPNCFDSLMVWIRLGLCPVCYSGCDPWARTLMGMWIRTLDPITKLGDLSGLFLPLWFCASMSDVSQADEDELSFMTLEVKGMWENGFRSFLAGSHGPSRLMFIES